MGQTDLSTDSNPGRNGTPGANGQQYDVVTFRNLAGLPALVTGTNFQIVVTPHGDPGLVSGDEDEANLDVEWAGAAAPYANLVICHRESQQQRQWDLRRIRIHGGQCHQTSIFPNMPNILSMSYGVCEPQVAATDQNALTLAGQQANAQGQTIVFPSGDSGAADCDTTEPATHGLSVDFPGSMPYATSMGGTTFTGDATNSS